MKTMLAHVFNLLCAIIAMTAVVIAARASSRIDELQKEVAAANAAARLGGGCDVHGVQLSPFQVADRRLTALEAVVNSMAPSKPPAPVGGVIASPAASAVSRPVAAAVLAEASEPETPAKDRWSGTGVVGTEKGEAPKPKTFAELKAWLRIPANLRRWDATPPGPDRPRQFLADNYKPDETYPDCKDGRCVAARQSQAEPAVFIWRGVYLTGQEHTAKGLPGNGELPDQ